MAKFHKEIPFLHKNDLLNGIVQVSEWNFDPTSLEIMAMSSESASVNLIEVGLRTRLADLKLYVGTGTGMAGQTMARFFPANLSNLV